ncbi:MAG: beta-N-acetylhexosaminidase [Chloroflexota bacterium]|nr:beta-N-acetylhexosaminidase [Chloroflexota bacterium]
MDPRAVTATRDRLLVSFDGLTLSPAEAEAIARRAAGVTLYRHLNVRSAGQVRALTDTLQAAAVRLGLPPLLVGADHETGQLHALGDDATPFAGAMALGATGDLELAERVSRAIGRELRAMGINLVYAPVCDLATNPRNPVVGIRAFGDEPVAVGRLAAATVRGLQSAGVAATVKHLPGHGEPGGDSHLGLPVIERSAAELRARELVPFRSAITAGARVAMAGHLAVPALTGRRDLPATLAREIVHDLLRDELGFDGLVVSDALDMGGVRGDDGAPNVGGALRAGIDLLLCGPDPDAQLRVEAGLARAMDGLDRAEVAASARRLAGLRDWLAGFGDVELDVVGGDEHRALADELAERSITRIRDRDGLIPAHLPADARILVIEPHPSNLTPADTSVLLPPGGLAAAIRDRHPTVESIVVVDAVPDSEVGSLRELALAADLTILGTVDALGRPTIVKLARALAAGGRPVVAVALRGPWDADAYPEVGTVLATYGSQAPSLAALVAAVWGDAPLTGRLPVRLAGA